MLCIETEIDLKLGFDDKIIVFENTRLKNKKTFILKYFMDFHLLQLESL